MTPYAGVGTQPAGRRRSRTSIPTPGTRSTWATSARTPGGYFEWQKNSPWYFRADGNQVTFSGTKVGSAANGTSPGNGFVDLAFPVAVHDRQLGRRGRLPDRQGDVRRCAGTTASSTTRTRRCKWTNPFFGGNQLDTTYLPPDNTFNKFTLTGNYRDLPWRSVLSARYTWAKTTSNVDLAPERAEHRTGVYPPTLPERRHVQRRERQPVVRARAGRRSRSRTSIPVSTTTGRAAEQLGRRRRSATTPTQPLPTGLGCGNAAGGGRRPGRRATAKTSSSAIARTTSASTCGGASRRASGWASATTTSTSTRTASTTTRCTGTRCGSSTRTRCSTSSRARIKYQYLKRDATSNFSNDGVSAERPQLPLPYTSAFDMQSSTTNLVKLNLDWSPLPLLGFSFEGNWTKTGLRRSRPTAERAATARATSSARTGAMPAS